MLSPTPTHPLGQLRGLSETRLGTCRARRAWPPSHFAPAETLTTPSLPSSPPGRMLSPPTTDCLAMDIRSTPARRPQGGEEGVAGGALSFPTAPSPPRAPPHRLDAAGAGGHRLFACPRPPQQSVAHGGGQLCHGCGAFCRAPGGMAALFWGFVHLYLY